MSKDVQITMSVQTSRGTLLMGFAPRESFRERPGCEPFCYPQIVHQLPAGVVTVVPKQPVNDDKEGVAS